MCLLLVAVAPLGSAGLASMLAGALGARFFWSGVVTLRAPIWRSRYPAHTRAARWIITNVGMHSRMLLQRQVGFDAFMMRMRART